MKPEVILTLTKDSKTKKKGDQYKFPEAQAEAISAIFGSAQKTGAYASNLSEAIKQIDPKDDSTLVSIETDSFTWGVVTPKTTKDLKEVLHLLKDHAPTLKREVESDSPVLGDEF